MGQRSNSCACCAQNCDVMAPSTLATQPAWDTLAGSWDAPTGTLTGTAITKNTANGPQYWRAIVTANEPNQVLDILFGCDADGEPDLFVRLTFGDSNVADSCGSIQLFEGGVALEDAQPVYGLVDGLSQRVDICFDAAFSRLFVDVFGGAGGFPLPPIVVVATATALISDDADGRMGLRLFDSQGGTVDVTVTSWSRIFTRAETCTSCHICGTHIGGFIAETSPDDQSTSVTTVSGPFYFGLNINGFASVDSHLIISDLDRLAGYGIQASGSAYLSATEDTVVEVYSDDYVARLTIGPRAAGSCPGFVTTTYHHTTLVELFKGGVLQFSESGCVGNSFSDLELFTFGLFLIFCDGSVTARGGAQIGILASTIGNTVAGEPGDGPANGATTTRGGIQLIGITRCMECSYCEECDEVETAARSWQVEIEGQPNTYDGTYILSQPNGICTSQNISSGVVWQITNRRHNMLISSAFASGVSGGPITDCDNLADEVIPIWDGTVINVIVTTPQQGSGSLNEIQSVRFSQIGTVAGTFTLTLGTDTTGSIAFDADAAAVQTALESLPSIGVGNVSVTKTPQGGFSSASWEVEFIGDLALTDVPKMTGTSDLIAILKGTATVNSL